MKLFIGILIVAGLCKVSAGHADPAGQVEVVVREPTASAKVDPRLFGQFLERTRGDANGAEAEVNPTGGFSPALIDKIKLMQIPVVRFPGGTTVDEIDWTEMIDHVPGHEGSRPVTHFSGGQTTTNRFGYDEYFSLRDQLHCQTILVLNVLDALSKKKPLEEAATAATGLLAYTNAPVDSPLPAGMPDWPSVRAANGHREPFRADYVQLGNEWFVPRFKDAVTTSLGSKDPADIAAWYVECLKSYVTKIRQIDPQIPIIVDGLLGSGVSAKVLGDPFIRANIRYVTFHSYGPGGIDKLTRDGADFPASKMTTDDWWNLFVSVPGDFSAAGENIGIGTHLGTAKALGYHIVCTEWNWMAFGFNRMPELGIGRALPSALGAAGFLNGLLRQAASVEMATQSNLVSTWDLGAIQRERSESKESFHYSPMARAAMLYHSQHGDQLLECKVKGNTLFQVNVAGTWNQAPTTPFAHLDVVATRSPGKLYLHVVNRHRDQAVPIHLDAAAVGLVAGEGTHFLLTGKTASAAEKGSDSVLEETQVPVKVSGISLDFVVPPASVNILALPAGRADSLHSPP